MTKKQTIIYIIIGVALVLVYWIFFGGGDKAKNEKEEQADDHQGLQRKVAAHRKELHDRR